MRERGAESEQAGGPSTGTTSSPGTESTEGVVTATGATTAVATATRARLLAVRLAAAAVIAVLVAWGLAATRPAIATTGSSWQDPAFVERPAPGTDPDGIPDGGDESWVVLGSDDGAWASMSLHNTRPYSITVTAPEPGPGADVQVALIDGWTSIGMITPDSLAPADSITVAGHRPFAVLLHVSDRCLDMPAGGSIGTGTTALDVASLGLHTSVDVHFPTTYMAGPTVDHSPAADCAP